MRRELAHGFSTPDSTASSSQRMDYTCVGTFRFTQSMIQEFEQGMRRDMSI